MAKKKTWEQMTEREKYLYIICKNHSGKMEGMWSLSTSVLKNALCIAHRMVKGSICEHCYAHQMASYRKSQAVKLDRATEFLTSHIIAYADIPLINAQIFRLEAFGDLSNGIQVVNFFNLAEKNGGTVFTLWTKNPHLIKEAMATYGIKKPSNLIIIVSSLFINYELDLRKVQVTYPFVDKVFTVYDKAFIAEKGIQINCGARHCFTCRKCYTLNNGIDYLREIKK